MKPLFVMLLIAVTCNGFSQIQTDQQARQFLNDFVHSNEKPDNLHYKATLYPETIDRIVTSLNYRDSDSAFYSYQDKRRACFPLSVEEKEQIRNIWLSQKNKRWDSTLIEHAGLFINPPLPPENFTREQAREYLNHFEGKHIVQFSIPVFLRNNSLCIFYYASYDGGAIYVMKNENQKWIKSLEKVVFYN